jgi:ubiquinone/menaquinone biosynthesis C-methylase UbiE
MDNHQKINLLNWNDRALIHAKSTFYDVDSFRAGRQTLRDIELSELPDVAGKSLLHLQCHFGMDTLSWAKLGANVTGIDFSDKAIDLAINLSDELGLNARFVQSNVYDLPQVLDEKFDIVFTSYGVLCWLNDLQKWANVIQHFLKPGGVFLIVEEHPLMFILDEACEPSLVKIGYSYFSKEVLSFNDGHSYTGPEDKVENSLNYQWTHTLEEIISAVLKSGLQIQSFHEYPLVGYQKFNWLVQDGNGWWRLPPECKIDIPLLFSLKARKT